MEEEEYTHGDTIPMTREYTAEEQEIIDDMNNDLRAAVQAFYDL